MRHHVRHLAVLLIGLLVSQPAAGLVCQASCLLEAGASTARPLRATHEPSCHSQPAPPTGTTRMADADARHCSHEIPDQAVAAARPNAPAERPLIALPASFVVAADAARSVILPGSSDHAPPGRNVFGAALPLRI